MPPIEEKNFLKKLYYPSYFAEAEQKIPFIKKAMQLFKKSALVTAGLMAASLLAFALPASFSLFAGLINLAAVLGVGATISCFAAAETANHFYAHKQLSKDYKSGKLSADFKASGFKVYEEGLRAKQKALSLQMEQISTQLSDIKSKFSIPAAQKPPLPPQQTPADSGVSPANTTQQAKPQQDS